MEEEELMDAEYARVRALDDAIDAERLMRKGGAFQTLLEKARSEALEGVEALIRADFPNLDEVRKAQWQVTRYEDLVRWIKDIFEEGESARDDLGEEEAARFEAMIRGETTEKDA